MQTHFGMYNFFFPLLLIDFGNLLHRKSSQLGKCYWSALNNRCPSGATHLWTKLSEAIQSWECTRFYDQ